MASPIVIAVLEVLARNGALPRSATCRRVRRFRQRSSRPESRHHHLAHFRWQRGERRRCFLGIEAAGARLKPALARGHGRLTAKPCRSPRGPMAPLRTTRYNQGTRPPAESIEPPTHKCILDDVFRGAGPLTGIEHQGRPMLGQQSGQRLGRLLVLRHTVSAPTIRQRVHPHAPASVAGLLFDNTTPRPAHFPRTNHEADAVTGSNVTTTRIQRNVAIMFARHPAISRSC